MAQQGAGRNSDGVLSVVHPRADYPRLDWIYTPVNANLQAWQPADLQLTNSFRSDDRLIRHRNTVFQTGWAEPTYLNPNLVDLGTRWPAIEMELRSFRGGRELGRVSPFTEWVEPTWVNPNVYDLGRRSPAMNTEADSCRPRRRYTAPLIDWKQAVDWITGPVFDPVKWPGIETSLRAFRGGRELQRVSVQVEWNQPTWLNPNIYDTGSRIAAIVELLQTARPAANASTLLYQGFDAQLGWVVVPTGTVKGKLTRPGEWVTLPETCT